MFAPPPPRLPHIGTRFRKKRRVPKKFPNPHKQKQRGGGTILTQNGNGFAGMVFSRMVFFHSRMGMKWVLFSGMQKSYSQNGSFHSRMGMEWVLFSGVQKAILRMVFFDSRMGKTHSEWFFIRRAMGMEWFSEILDGKNHSRNVFSILEWEWNRF